MQAELIAPPEAQRSRWRSRAVLIALFVLFFGPILVALALNIWRPDWQPFGAVNHGELIQPPAQIELSAIRPVDGAAFSVDDFADRWVLIHVSPLPCEARCTDALVRMRQARLALGKDAGRVARAWLLTGPVEIGALAQVLPLHPGLRVLAPGPTTLAELTAPATPGDLYLLDPGGRLVLRFPDTLDARDMLKDLRRLLRISKQG